MESNFRLESHVAQRSRRDKLRVHQNNSTIIPAQYLEQLSVNQGVNPDLSDARYASHNNNLSYDQTMFSSEMLNFMTSSNSQIPLVSHQGHSAAPAQPDRSKDSSFTNLSQTIISSSSFNPSSKVSGDPQINCSTWKSIGSQQRGDWISANYSSGSTGIESNQNPLFVGEALSTQYMNKPSYHHGVQSSLTSPSSEISSQNSQKHYEEMRFHSPPLYDQKTHLQEFITSAGSTATLGLEMASLVHQNIGEIGRGSWGNGGNELLLLPTYGDQSNVVGLSDAFARTNRPVEGCHDDHWSGELGILANKGDTELRTFPSDSNTQGLSLSLSPVPQFKTHGGLQLGERCESEHVRSRTGVFNDLPDSDTLKPGYLCSNSEQSSGGKVFGINSTSQDMVGTSNFTHRHTGPLGPFTGYATILKSSKYLKPAQQLLDEFCGVNGPKPIKTCEVSDKASVEVRVSVDAANASESVVGAKGGDSGVSSSTFFSSNEISGEAGVGSSSSESYGPEYQQKKAKLLFMQEEICKRYRQYHQQMQMVVSSFEAVAGLSAATPYISLALKTVMRNFRCLKNAISDQLKHIRKALGEDLSSPTTGASSSKGDASTSRQKLYDYRFQKDNPGGGNLGFFEPQHVWRPQRGLPERSVAVLRAWLFDHFLHPYPTDTDKHLLATQTGLTRNQVSNWFINARVRVWKPMVEEIHMLETKGSAEANSNPVKNDGKETTGVSSLPNEDQCPTNRLGINAMSNNQVDCSDIGDVQSIAKQWNREKRSRMDCHIPGSIDGSLMGIGTYQQSSRGLGAVSLTLGLRQSAESAQQQQQLQQQEHQLRHHFGGQMIHDFVG
ncbi:BEL1-like homeodomain protein 4 [Cornus florida]|uniref:BEL1-like homeodomain protein 4 n=1 Tax=Cornus florida TaxID=4283 RepID=UPI0028A14472|nr:BEL1-like homeodomain protein 4 [Cornus florida]XP_059659458.1 BEL1-like homeodomain protein 4 [Cornus florida]